MLEPTIDRLCRRLGYADLDDVWPCEPEPRFHAHFTPTSGSWLNLVEIWLGIIERQAIRRGSYGSVADLVATIRRFINGWSPRAHPFIWTKTPNQITRKRKHVSSTGH